MRWRRPRDASPFRHTLRVVQSRADVKIVFHPVAARHDKVGSSGIVGHSQFQSFQSFNPPDQVRGPFKSLSRSPPIKVSARRKELPSEVWQFLEAVKSGLGATPIYRTVEALGRSLRAAGTE